jgi:thioesterase domain-containing protein
MAKRLEAAGERVAFLGCIDWAPCFEPKEVPFNMEAALALILHLIPMEKYLELNAQLYPTVPPGIDPTEYVLRFASRERMRELDVDARRFALWARVSQATEEQLFRLVTAGRVRNMTLFCSGGQSEDDSVGDSLRPAWRAELVRWGEFVDDLRVVDIAGTHHTLMGPRHVASFQAVLRAEIQRAESSLG